MRKIKVQSLLIFIINDALCVCNFNLFGWKRDRVILPLLSTFTIVF